MVVVYFCQNNINEMHSAKDERKSVSPRPCIPNSHPVSPNNRSESCTMMPVSRRNFIASATVATAAANAVNAQTPIIPIIDTHIHLFDQTRPQGAPYFGNAGNTQPSFPATYRTLAPAGIVGAIHIEASPWIEDNLWV